MKIKFKKISKNYKESKHVIVQNGIERDSLIRKVKVQKKLGKVKPTFVKLLFLLLSQACVFLFFFNENFLCSRTLSLSSIILKEPTYFNASSLTLEGKQINS